jgi:hypothetical protein
VRLPMPAGCVIAQAHAAFIDKDVVPRVAQRQPVASATPLSGDVGAPLFVGVYRVC